VFSRLNLGYAVSTFITAQVAHRVNCSHENVGSDDRPIGEVACQARIDNLESSEDRTDAK
jgi:hypothetical protein